jgi:hypothetical protein
LTNLSSAMQFCPAPCDMALGHGLAPCGIALDNGSSAMPPSTGPHLLVFRNKIMYPVRYSTGFPSLLQLKPLAERDIHEEFFYINIYIYIYRPQIRTVDLFTCSPSSNSRICRTKVYALFTHLQYLGSY